MANEANFSDILDRAPTEVEKPKPIPQGTYTTILVGLPRHDKSAKKQTPFIEFTHKIVAAGDDVDQDALAEALGERSLQDMTMKNTFYLTEGSAWRLKQFLADCGLDVEDDSHSLRELTEQTTGRSVNIYINHEPSQDGQSVFAKVGSTAAVE